MGARQVGTALATTRGTGSTADRAAANKAVVVTVHRLGIHPYRSESHRTISDRTSLPTASIHKSLGFSLGSRADSQRRSRVRDRRAVEPAARVANRGPAEAGGGGGARGRASTSGGIAIAGAYGLRGR